MTPDEPCVFLVDDDQAVLRSIDSLLRSAGYQTATFSSPQEFIEDHDPGQPGCVLLDVAMPGLNGLSVQKKLTALGAERPIVFLTGLGSIPMSVQAMKAGAVDFLSKPVDEEELLAAIETALVRDRTARAVRREKTRQRAQLGRLTTREFEVMGQILTGRLNKQIADVLGTSERTVKFHRGHLMKKLGLQSVAELVRFAEQAGMKPPD